jgi:hypothetical protein
MGTLEDAQFANQLGHLYQSVAQQIGDYLTNNIDHLTKEEIDTVNNYQTTIITYANTFYSLSDNIAFTGSDLYFNQINDATGQIKDALNHLDNINKIINISAGIISLAAAVMTGNGPLIVTSIVSIVSFSKSLGSTSN